MLKVKQGDLDKLGLLFERYNRRLFHFFYRLTHRRDVSEDLVQGVFERILKHRNTYTENGAFSAWIFQIARNLQIDHYRKNQKYQLTAQEVNWNQMEGAPGELPSMEEADTDMALLQQALSQLDNTKRQTLVLSRFEGFKYKEIAEIMDCSESAVKVRVYRALQELKVCMKELKRKNYD
ncbi:RNA polymerase sigma factor [Aliifodinibius sp. 1BSP15-2V2]|uniref:RNA polymerase sigma factor n=2 Tax=Fodinibius salsisoli TaxID=2820877 RepID=A0ABT3PR72_9BACT|nr:RNA polymerase sigma factor [Fodinibius salsisoli]MCW9708346.1 RNA polymerase sigma factor [Fodinibius salsisoli]